MTSAPLVSICIPTFNNATMVADALASALAQNHAPLEILVLDNHSSDDTPEVIRRVAGNDPRVRSVRHPANVGMAGNFNQALALSTGALVLILCADDLIAPRCASVLAAALTAEPSAVMAACGRQLIDGQLQPKKVERPRNQRETVEGSALTLECFARGNIIGEPSAVMFRRSAAERGFREEYHQLLDMEMWFHLLSQGNAVFVPDVLSSIRRHSGQWSNTNMLSGRVMTDKRALFRDFALRLGPRLSVRQKLQWDARMASSVERTRRAQGSTPEDVNEVFHPFAFRVFRGLATAAYAATALVAGPRA